MNPLKFALLTSMSLALFCNTAEAQGIPVYDAAGYAQFVQQLDQMTKEDEKQLQQLDQAMAQTNALTGTRGMGSLKNSPLEAELRRIMPETWQETMQMMEAQGLTGGAFGTQSLYSNLRQTYNPLSGAEFMPDDPTGAIAQSYDRQANTTYAALSTSEQAFNGAAVRLETYESLLSEIDNTPYLKASIDLQSRIAAENGMALNESNRLQAIQIQQQAARDNQGLVTTRRGKIANLYNASETDAIFKK